MWMDGDGGHLAPTRKGREGPWSVPSMVGIPHHHFGNEFISDVPDQAFFWALKLPAELLC